jgi:hypothetical protein
MSKNVHLTTQTNIRLPKIKYGLMHKQTREQIGTLCNVTEKTIRRDIQAWIKTEDFYQWLHELWLHLYGKIDNVELVFKEVTRLLGKGMTQKVETKLHKIDEKRTVEIKALLKDYDAVFERVAQDAIRKNSVRKQVATPPET